MLQTILGDTHKILAAAANYFFRQDKVEHRKKSESTYDDRPHS